MLDNLRQDTRRLRLIKSKPFPWYVLESLLFETGYQAVVLHRLAAWCKRHRLPVLGPAIARCNQFLTGVEIGPGAQIGPGLVSSTARASSSAASPASAATPSSSTR